MNEKTHDRQVDIAGAAPVTVRFHGRRGCEAGAPLVLHFHGGTFASGTLEDGAPIAQALADAGAVVASVDYPLAPAHRFPEIIEVGYGVLAWMHRWRMRVCGTRDARVFVAGEEAGGNIAAAVATMARDRGRHEPDGQILVTPLLDPCIGTRSMRDANAGPVGCKYADGWHDYLRTPLDADHPYAAPAHAQRLAGLPPTWLFTEAAHPTRDEALAFAARLAAAGVQARAEVMPAGAWPRKGDRSAGHRILRDSVREIYAPRPAPEFQLRTAT